MTEGLGSTSDARLFEILSADIYDLRFSLTYHEILVQESPFNE